MIGIHVPNLSGYLLRWGVIHLGEVLPAIPVLLLQNVRTRVVEFDEQKLIIETTDAPEIVPIGLLEPVPSEATHFRYRFEDRSGDHPKAFLALALAVSGFVLKFPEQAADSSVLQTARRLQEP
jgi:hypothetical protein